MTGIFKPTMGVKGLEKLKLIDRKANAKKNLKNLKLAPICYLPWTSRKPSVLTIYLFILTESNHMMIFKFSAFTIGPQSIETIFARGPKQT